MEKPLTISQIYTKGTENLNSRGKRWEYPPLGRAGNSLRTGRKYLDNIFFVTKFLDPQPVDTNLTLFGTKLKTPIFCTAISRLSYMPETSIQEIAKGIAAAGSFIMLGFGGSAELQSAIDTGAPVIKIIKPYRETELIYKELRESESRGCIAIGMDIDHFYGRLGLNGDVTLTELFAPQSMIEMRQMISQTKLPFIIKGVLSDADAERAVDLGASAIVVSNHSSASLESEIPSIVALPGIAEKYHERITIFVDSGFETGNDALKAMALGANAVGFGRPMVLAWLAEGIAGVELLVNQISIELRRTMAATGCPNLGSIVRSCIVRAHEIA